MPASVEPYSSTTRSPNRASNPAPTPAPGTPQASRAGLSASPGAGGALWSIVSVAPMKSKTVAPKWRTSSQKPEGEKRAPSAAVVPSSSAGMTVRPSASRWKSG